MEELLVLLGWNKSVSQSGMISYAYFFEGGIIGLLGMREGGILA